MRNDEYLFTNIIHSCKVIYFLHLIFIYMCVYPISSFDFVSISYISESISCLPHMKYISLIVIKKN